jgi:CheY-like chemotaxis protein
MEIGSDQPLLIVEDSPEDYEATVRSLTRSGWRNRIIHCEDGDDALDYLQHRGSFSDPLRAPRPALILLDLNLPGTDGREVLAAIKQDERLKSIPVLILTTSRHEEDVKACYRAGANSYIQKPVDLSLLHQSLDCMTQFWFNVATLPSVASTA